MERFTGLNIRSFSPIKFLWECFCRARPEVLIIYVEEKCFYFGAYFIMSYIGLTIIKLVTAFMAFTIIKPIGKQ